MDLATCKFAVVQGACRRKSVEIAVEILERIGSAEANAKDTEGLIDVQYDASVDFAIA